MSEHMLKEWEFILDETPQRGSYNMAVDDYLFRSLTQYPMTRLRFYQWKRPTVSLGFLQKIDKVLNLEFCRENGIDVVRRITGGKLVLHWKEITYSVCSSDHSLFSLRLLKSYKLISQALMLGLKKMGISPGLAAHTPSNYSRGNLPCFAYSSRDEVEVKGKKIIGSAQKREGARFIQHGSIPREGDDGLLGRISSMENEESRARRTSLFQILNYKIEYREAVECFTDGFREYFDVKLTPKKFSKSEMEEITRIQEHRYESMDWTLYRK